MVKAFRLQRSHGKRCSQKHKWAQPGWQAKLQAKYSKLRKTQGSSYKEGLLPWQAQRKCQKLLSSCLHYAKKSLERSRQGRERSRQEFFKDARAKMLGNQHPSSVQVGRRGE